MEYKIFIDGKEVELRTKEIEIADRQGSQADSIRVHILNDPTLQIDRGSLLECTFGGFKTGRMNIDSIGSTSTNTYIGAISSPLGVKKKRTRHWLKVRLFDIVNDVATNSGTSVFYHGVENFLYENVTQYHETDLAFLNRLCEREGYALKIDDNRMVIYNKALAESAKSVKKIGFGDVVNNHIRFSENPNKVRSVTVRYFADRLISYTTGSGISGEDLIVCEYVANEAEAERFAKGYFARATENDTTVDVIIPITDGVAAGNIVEFEDFARFNGRYFVTECHHDPENSQTRIKGRKVL